MIHSFDVEIAKKYGVHSAIIFEYFQELFLSAVDKRDNYYDGNHWVRISLKDLSEQIPYISSRQIRISISKLVNGGLLIKGNYNTSKYDRTTWYTVKL